MHSVRDSLPIAPMAPDDSALAAVTDPTADSGIPPLAALSGDDSAPAAQTEASPGENSVQPDDSAAAIPVPVAPIDPRTQLRLRSEGDYLVLLMPSLPQTETEGGALSWGELLQQFKQRLTGGEPFWQPNTVVQVAAGDRLLDTRQLQELEDLLTAAQLKLKRVITRRRQTAIAAVTAGFSVDQLEAEDPLVQSPPLPGKPLAEPLYLQTTVRSGVEIRHPGTIVVRGDANPGSSLVAEGDILVWGRLRGTAHAGSGGDRDRYIMALHLQPTQIRLADLVARAPEGETPHYLPEIAYVGDNAIRIAQAQDFARQNFNATLGRGAQPTDGF